MRVSWTVKECCHITKELEVKLNLAKDPVCGMSVDEKTSKLKSEYKGRTYYFCSQSDKATFDKNPTKYVS